MDARLQRRVQRYGWDLASSQYERFWRDQLRPAQDRLLEMAALRPGERVLDVACGTGLVTFPAAEAVGPAGAVFATDLSDAMVRALRDTARRLGHDHVRAERMDAESLAVEDASFDAALCALGLMYVPDPIAALREMRRAVVRNGRVLAAVWGAREHCGWADVFPIVDARVATEVCPLFFQLGTGDSLAYALDAAAIHDVETARVTATLHYPSGDAAVGAAFVGGPVALAYSRFDEATRDAVHAEYLASIEPFRQGRGYAIPGEFVVACGTT